MNSKTADIISPKSFFLFAIMSILPGCGDPPLLKTDLPNGYSFHSNGGIFGYIARPNGQRMSNQFGILQDGTEQWCNGFGWYGDYVICELEIVDSGAEGGYITKYFMMNTKNENILILKNLEEAEKKWVDLVGVKLQNMAKRHSSTRKK